MNISISLIGQDDPDCAILEAINEEAFPPCERNSIADLYATGGGRLDMLGIYENGALCGFFTMRRFERIRYLAYFAVAREFRGNGIGSGALRLLREMYPDTQIVVEYESPEMSAQAARRREFYLRNGFFETGYETFYDETEFRIACSARDFDAAAFGRFTAYLSRLVNDHIPAPYRRTDAES